MSVDDTEVGQLLVLSGEWQRERDASILEEYRSIEECEVDAMSVVELAVYIAVGAVEHLPQFVVSRRQHLVVRAVAPVKFVESIKQVVGLVVLIGVIIFNTYAVASQSIYIACP